MPLETGRPSAFRNPQGSFSRQFFDCRPSSDEDSLSLCLDPGGRLRTRRRAANVPQTLGPYDAAKMGRHHPANMGSHGKAVLGNYDEDILGDNGKTREHGRR